MTFFCIATNGSREKKKRKKFYKNEFTPVFFFFAVTDSHSINHPGPGNAAIFDVSCALQNSYMDLDYDQGYMADSECMRRLAKSADDTDSQKPPSEFTISVSKSVSRKSPDLSSIRQSMILARTRRPLATGTLGMFVCCILHLYLMLGPYGVLAGQEEPAPYPWLVFHTVCR